MSLLLPAQSNHSLDNRWAIYKQPDGFSYAYKDSNDNTEVPFSVFPDKFLNLTTGNALGT